MNINEKKLLIFDYDGTIADTNLLHEKAFSEVLAIKNISFEYKNIAGLKTIDAINQLLLKNKIYLKNDIINKLVIKKQKIFRDKIDKEIKPIEGVVDFLDWAKPKFNLYVASSGSKKNVYKGLKILGLLNYFQNIFCSEDVNLTKPSPEIFLKVLSINQMKVEDALIFEDSDNGIEAAINANINYIDIRKNSFNSMLFKIKKYGNL